jgi:hypothetical protein
VSTIIRSIDHGVRTIDTCQVTITELVWADGGRSFEAHLADGTDLTQDGCFDEYPNDEQLRELLHHRPGSWTCPGCRRHIDDSQADLIVDHVRDCDLVDGAGHAIIAMTDGGHP